MPREYTVFFEEPEPNSATEIPLVTTVAGIVILNADPARRNLATPSFLPLAACLEKSNLNRERVETSRVAREVIVWGKVGEVWGLYTGWNILEAWKILEGVTWRYKYSSKGLLGGGKNLYGGS